MGSNTVDREFVAGLHRRLTSRVGSERLWHATFTLLLVFTVACQGPVEFTEADRQEALDYLRPPASNDDRNDFIESCLEENAVSVYERTPDGLFSGVQVTERDQSVMRTCMDEGFAEFPPGPKPVTPVQHAVFYELYLLQAECLEQLDISINMPSLDTYIDDGGEWSPYVDVEPAILPDHLTWQDVNELCPQSPWHYHVDN